MDLGMIGPAIVLGLSCTGSAIGCGIGAMAGLGVMSRVDENHGKFIGLFAMPSSQSIYGLVLMILMSAKIKANALAPLPAAGIGLFVGIAIMISAIYQGMCAAAGIQAVAKQPSVFGKSIAALGIVESFSLFAFVFGFILIR